MFHNYVNYISKSNQKKTNYRLNKVDRIYKGKLKTGKSQVGKKTSNPNKGGNFDNFA